MESNGPDVKVRGTAQQVLDKYLALAQDAVSTGDRIAAEGYLQHADHYYRLLNGDGGGQNSQGRGGHGHGMGPTPFAPTSGPFDTATDDDPAAPEQPAEAKSASA